MKLSNNFYQDIWMKLVEIFHHLDQIMEKLIREAIEEIEKTYQKD